MKHILHFSILLLLCAAVSSCSNDEGSALLGGPETYRITLQEGDTTGTFRVDGKTLKISGTPKGYLRTTKQYDNFTLSCRWRWVGRSSDGGIYVYLQDGDRVWPDGVQMQMASDGLGVIMGGIALEGVEPDSGFYRKPILTETSGEKPVGRWNKTVIVSQNGHLDIYLNDVKVNEAQCAARSGYIGFQSEGGPMEICDLTIKEE